VRLRSGRRRDIIHAGVLRSRVSSSLFPIFCPGTISCHRGGRCAGCDVMLWSKQASKERKQERKKAWIRDEKR